MESKYNNDQLWVASVKRYGNDPHSFAQQRDGFIEGARWMENELDLKVGQADYNWDAQQNEINMFRDSNRKLREALEKTKAYLPYHDGIREEIEQTIKDTQV